MFVSCIPRFIDVYINHILLKLDHLKADSTIENASTFIDYKLHIVWYY